MIKMAVEIVTGFQGKPHVTANDTACFNQGVVGSGEYVLNIGKKFAATVVTNNQIRIDDGEAVMQGVHFRIHPNTYINVTIENGNQGVKRKDIIVARYTKERSTGIEKIQIVVVKGTPSADNPRVPSLKKGDIRVGTETNEMLLYVVSIDGLNIAGVTKSFEEMTSIADINKKRLQKLSEIMAATQPGFFVDALAAKELFKRSKFEIKNEETAINLTVLGKQVYTRSFEVHPIPSNTTTRIPISVPDAKYIWLDTSNSYAYNVQGGEIYPIPYNSPKYVQNGLNVWIYNTPQKQELVIETATVWPEKYYAWIVVRYYKK